MTKRDGYALNLHTPVRHVATELDRAAPAALSIAELAASYSHSNPGDLARIKLHEHRGSDDEAITYLIERATGALAYQGKTKRSRQQLVSNGDGWRLAIPFEELRYEGERLIRRVETDESDVQRALRAAYNGLRADRAVQVVVQGARGGLTEKRLELHPLARAIPQIPEEEFFELAGDIRRNGVELPITLWNGEILDGRHRAAVASALQVPIKISEVEGDEARARARVLSLNVSRRHLTSAQRAMIVRQLFLPEAKTQAKERHKANAGDRRSASATLRGPIESAKAAEIAVKESGALATVRAVEALAPLDEAPKTQERVARGEIKTVARARVAALEEIGRHEEAKKPPPVVQPRSAWDRLGCALGDVRSACESLEKGVIGKVSPGDVLGRIMEIRGHLDRAEKLAQQVSEK